MSEINPVEESTVEAVSKRGPNRRGWRGFLRFPKTWREVRALGWKFVLAFVLFYLIRDTILYIVIPYLVYKGIISR
ncbi:MAG: hypothetical protein AB1644_11110 [Candidatus Zixiibacteriota bacterium]